MDNVISWAHKLDKQNIMLPGTTTDPSNEPSTNSNSHEKLNENTDITSNESLTAETYSSTKSCVHDKPSGIIQT